jgi:hypothetical protein
MIVALVCDGYDAITEVFKKFAHQKKFFDEKILQKMGFMERTRDDDWKMKTMGDLMKGVRDENVPKNCLHLF